MVDADGNIIQSAVDEYERITKSKFPLEGVTETLWGNTEIKKLLKNAGYDGVYSFSIDGEVFVAITDKATIDANPKSISEAYHAAKAKPENTRTEQEQQLIKAIEDLLTPKTTQNAVQKPSTTQEVSRTGERGENKPEGGEGVGQGKQGEKAATESVQEKIDTLVDKTAPASERRKIMQENPLIKRIFDNIKELHNQLEEKGLITKKGNCP